MADLWSKLGNVLGDGYAIYEKDVRTEHLIDLSIGSWNFQAFEYTAKTRVALSFDVIEETNFRGSSTVTNYPREDGVMVSDYKYQNPSVLTVNGIVSRKSVVGNLISMALDGGTNVQRMKERLHYYKSGMYPLDIQTKSGLYENYTLESYEIPEDYDSYGLMNVSMTFKEMFKAADRQETLPPAKDTISSGISRLLGLN